MNKDYLDTIIQNLSRLTIQQQHLTQKIADLQIEIQRCQQDIVESNNNGNPTQELSVKPRPEKNTQKRTIKVGDRVGVKNPGRNQPNNGTVHSHTLSRLFVRVKLDN